MSDTGPLPPEPPRRPEPWTEDRSGAPAPSPGPERPSLLDPPTVPDAARPAPATGPGPATDLAPFPDRRPMRLRTVVFGLVLLTVAVLSLLGAVAHLRLSVPMVAVTILVGAGFVLVAGGLSAALRESAGRSPH